MTAPQVCLIVFILAGLTGVLGSYKGRSDMLSEMGMTWDDFREAKKAGALADQQGCAK